MADNAVKFTINFLVLRRLIPFVEPGDAVRIIDTDYPTKEGTYYVTGTEVSFSKEGGKRTISLGRWLSK